MKLFNSWRKTFFGDDREAAFQALGIGNRMTLYRYKKGTLPSTPVLIRMFILGYRLDREAFMAWMGKLSSTDEVNGVALEP